MKTVDSAWRNLAKGHKVVLRLELQLQVEWKGKVEQAQQRKYQADLDSWNHRCERRLNDHKNALAIWKKEIADKNLRLRDTMSVGTRRASVAIPVSVLVLVVMTLPRVAEIGAVQLILLGFLVGLAIAFAPAALSAVELVGLRSREPSLKDMEDPRPQQEKPVSLSLVDEWWRQVCEDRTYARKAVADYGDVGEDEFSRCLGQGLSDDYVGIRGILVKRGLDVDFLAVGPTNLWVFEVKHWSGVIICRDGNWRRSRSYYAQGGFLEHEKQEIAAFDQQWMREQKEVRETLRRRVQLSRLVDTIAGGIVFTHPDVSLDIDSSCKCGYGPPQFWVNYLRESAEKHKSIISWGSRLEIIDALLDRAKKIDNRYSQRHCCIELAERLAGAMADRAKNYVARHARP